ncbi:MAG TPA: CDP-glucose 4,6-dehydratase, partial [Planctomycetaceae bacterium]
FAKSPETTPSLFTAAGIGRDMISIVGDVRDLPAVRNVFAGHHPEIVFHLAAQPLVRRSYREPIETFSTNVMGTAHVLEAARETPSVRSVVVVTSDKCYDNREWVWGYRECEPMGGHDPYSASKGCAELITAAYRRSFFCTEGRAAVGSGRAGNVIGGGDWSEDRLIPDIVRSLVNGTPIVIRRPRAVRPWQHVLEPLRGYLMLAWKLAEFGHEFADGWNFGPHSQDALPVRELAELMVNFWGSGVLTIAEQADSPHEAGLLTLDSSKARSRLGWSSILRAPDAVRMTVEWYRDFYRRPQDAEQLLNRQIEEFSGLVAPFEAPLRFLRASA